MMLYWREIFLDAKVVPSPGSASNSIKPEEIG